MPLRASATATFRILPRWIPYLGLAAVLLSRPTIYVAANGDTGGGTDAATCSGSSGTIYVDSDLHGTDDDGSSDSTNATALGGSGGDSSSTRCSTNRSLSRYCLIEPPHHSVQGLCGQHAPYSSQDAVDGRKATDEIGDAERAH